MKVYVVVVIFVKYQVLYSC